MHELSIIEGTMKIVFQKAEDYSFKRIHKITIKVGELSGVLPHALQFAFKVCTKDTLAEGAELSIEEVKACAYCESCEVRYSIDHFNKICPQCGIFSMKIVSGYELYLDTIEGEE